jgi:hypothetical protein
LFDERFESDYLTKAGTSTQCVYTTLPVVDGFLWSTPENKAGLRIVDEKGNQAETNDPVVTELPDNVLKVAFSGSQDETFTLLFYEDRFELECKPGKKGWSLELQTAPDIELPFQTIDSHQINAALNGFAYSLACPTGTIEKSGGCVFRIKPDRNKIVVDCSRRFQ